MGFETGDRRQKTEERRKKQFSQRYAEKSAEVKQRKPRHIESGSMNEDL